MSLPWVIRCTRKHLILVSRHLSKGKAKSRYNIQQLCPIPQGPFHANGNLTIPDQYVSQIPAVAFSVPDVSLPKALLMTDRRRSYSTVNRRQWPNGVMSYLGDSEWKIN